MNILLPSDKLNYVLVIHADDGNDVCNKHLYNRILKAGDGRVHIHPKRIFDSLTQLIKHYQSNMYYYFDSEYISYMI